MAAKIPFIPSLLALTTSPTSFPPALLPSFSPHLPFSLFFHFSPALPPPPPLLFPCTISSHSSIFPLLSPPTPFFLLPLLPRDPHFPFPFPTPPVLSSFFLSHFIPIPTILPPPPPPPPPVDQLLLKGATDSSSTSLNFAVHIRNSSVSQVGGASQRRYDGPQINAQFVSEQLGRFMLNLNLPFREFPTLFGGHKHTIREISRASQL